MAMEQQAHSAVSSAERAVQSATEQLAHTAHQTVDSLRDYSERAETHIRDATERSRKLIDQVSDYIEAHPMAALGIAAGVGFVLGALAGRGAASHADTPQDDVHYDA